MKKRELLLFLLILIFSWGIIFWATKEPKEDRAWEEETRNYVFKIDRGSLKSLKTTIDGKDYYLLKKGEHWKIEGAKEADIDSLVEELLSTIGEIEKITSIEEQQGSAEAKEFGFDRPYMKLTLEYVNQVQSLIIGDAHPSKLSYYARLGGQKEIFTIGSLYPYLIRVRVKNLLLFLEQGKK